MAVTELDKTQVIVAPGQASIQVGKGLELFNHSEAAKKVWTDSEGLLGYPLSELALFGKVNGEKVKNSVAMGELTKTVNAQPTVVITSLAELAVLEEHGLLGGKRSYWNTGHSVGLVVALMTSGVLDAEGALKLADARRKAFKYAIEHGPEGGTGFLAVQHDKPEVVTQYVEDLTKRYPLVISLDNYDNQVILGGESRDLDEAMNYVRGKDARMASLFARLPVEAAYHSPFMKAAEEMFGEDVDKIDMQVPTQGVLVAGSMVDDDGTVHILDTVALIKTALVRQPTHTERWRPLMRFLKEQGVVRMIELNETPSLTSWNRRMFQGKREQINLPGVTGADGKDIAVAWTWDAPVKAEEEAASGELQTQTNSAEMDDEMAEMNEEVEGLLKIYASLEATDELTVMEQFIQLPAPETFGGMLLWYRQWMAFRRFKRLDEIKPETDYTRDLKGDSLDYEVLRADVEAVFGYPVDPEEAKNRTYPRIMAQATWEARKKLLGST